LKELIKVARKSRYLFYFPFFTFVVALLMLSGCASIVSGTNQSLLISTPGCPGASCDLSNDKGNWSVPQTPGSVVVHRAYGDLSITCRKGDETASTSVKSSTKGMAFGNILAGGGIGAGVDIATGAAYDYPQSISIPMNCDPGQSSLKPPKLPKPSKPQFTTTSLEIPSGRRVALVIGNADYKKSPLQNPTNDARDMVQILRTLKFDVIEVKDGSKGKMVESIDSFQKKLQQAKVGLFYYSGHGMQYQGNNYLIPVQAEISSSADLEQEAVDVRRILGRMEESSTELNIVVLDACRDNPFSTLSRGYKSNKGFAVLPRVRGALIAYSTQPDNVAADGTGRNSPYTKHLLKHLKRSPNLSVTDLFNEVGQSVLKETNGQQEPWISASPLPRFCFAKCN
jgi:uncharacterized protein YceK